MFDELRGLYYTLFLLKPTKQWAYVLATIVAVVITSSFSYTVTKILVEAKAPIITVYAPGLNAETVENTTTIVGKVIPADSKVVINGDNTSVNEQGTFSYQMPLQVGDNKYTIKANYLWKSAEYSHQIALINPATNQKIAQAEPPVRTPEPVLGKMKRTVEEN
jgi:Glucodextranase, domain B